METMKLADLQALPIFPFADEFPYLSDEEMSELAIDIRDNGLHHPIVLMADGETGERVVLDGRNRLRACAKVTGLAEAPVEYYSGDDPIGYVIALNMLRRHMEPGQRAALAVVALPFIEAWVEQQTKELKRKQALAQVRDEDGNFIPGAVDADLGIGGPKHLRTSASQAGEKFGVGKTSVTMAKSIQLNAPDLFAKLKSGEIVGVNTAYKEMQHRQNSTGSGYDGSKAHESEPEKLATQFESRITNAYGNFLDAIKAYSPHSVPGDLDQVKKLLTKIELEAEKLLV